MNHFIFGLATDHAQVLKAMAALAEVGIASDQVSVLMADRQQSGALATEIQANAAHGSFSAGNIGGGLGWLAGLSALAIPGIGLLFAAGPIVGFLTGIAVGRAVGSHRGAMIEEMGIPDIAVDHYEAAMNTGKIILAARCEDPALAERVSAALRRVGLQDVDSTSGAGRQAEPPDETAEPAGEGGEAKDGVGETRDGTSDERPQAGPV